MESFPHTASAVKNAFNDGEYDKASAYARSPFWQLESLKEALYKVCNTGDEGTLSDMRGKKITFEIFDDSSIYVNVYDKDEWD